MIAGLIELLMALWGALQEMLICLAAMVVSFVLLAIAVFGGFGATMLVAWVVLTLIGYPGY